jgi:2-dehydropantoate 2-reductase
MNHLAPLRIVVVGAGAVGGWVGGRLALGGHSVTLVGRQHVVDVVSGDGLRLQFPNQTNRVQELVVRELNAVTSVADAARYGPYDLALITVKTFDTEEAIAQLRAVEREVGWGNPHILSLQNGVRSEELLAEAFGPERVIAGTDLNPISVLAPGEILLEKRRGGIGLAPVVVGASVERWAQVFDRDVLPTHVYDDYRTMKWSKLLLNLVGNASAAILDMSSVEIYDDPRLNGLEIEMLLEALAVMRGLGLKPVGLPGYPVPLLAFGVRRAPPFVSRLILRKMVANGRGQKPPSLLQDMRNGREHCEVGDLNGAVVRAGEATGIPTPVNRTLTELLTRLFEKRLQWENIRRQPAVLLAVTAEMKRKKR